MRRLIDPTAQAERHVTQRLGMTPQSEITNAINDTARDAGDGGHALYDPTGRLIDPNATEVAFAGSTVAVRRNGKRSTVTVDAVNPAGDTMTGPLVIDSTNAGAFQVNTDDGTTQLVNVDTTAVPFLQTYNGLDLQMFSDAGTTRVFTIDGATGTIFFGTSTAIIVRTGSGTPEGSITAPIGSLYLRSNGTGAATLYVKTSGSGNTGWDAVSTIAGTQTETNKTLTSPVITTPAVSDPTLTKHLLTGTTTASFAALTAAGASGSAASSVGTDVAGLLQIVPGGAGIATGAFATITFGSAMPSSNYAVTLTPGSSAARTLGMVLGPTNRSTTAFDVSTATALTSGSTYQWHYHVISYG